MTFAKPLSLDGLVLGRSTSTTTLTRCTHSVVLHRVSKEVEIGTASIGRRRREMISPGRSAGGCGVDRDTSMTTTMYPLDTLHIAVCTALQHIFSTYLIASSRSYSRTSHQHICNMAKRRHCRPPLRMRGSCSPLAKRAVPPTPIAFVCTPRLPSMPAVPTSPALRLSVHPCKSIICTAFSRYRPFVLRPRTLSTSTTMPKIERITMFKIPSPSDLDRCLEQYKTLKRTAVKDGKPYVVSIDAGKAACVSCFLLCPPGLLTPISRCYSCFISFFFRFVSSRFAALH